MIIHFFWQERLVERGKEYQQQQYQKLPFIEYLLSVTYISKWNPHNNLIRHLLSLFAGEKSEAHGGKITCSSAYSLGNSWTSAQFDSKALAITSKEF